MRNASTVRLIMPYIQSRNDTICSRSKDAASNCLHFLAHSCSRNAPAVLTHPCSGAPLSYWNQCVRSIVLVPIEHLERSKEKDKKNRTRKRRRCGLSWRFFASCFGSRLIVRFRTWGRIGTEGRTSSLANEMLMWCDVVFVCWGIYRNHGHIGSPLPQKEGGEGKKANHHWWRSHVRWSWIVR